MSTLVCVPAHILDAHISPRAREVLMLLASQTSAAEPTLWICQAIVAERLRCSVATVARSIQKLVEAKLIAETGRLYEGRYKFYHVCWSSNENMKAVSKKIAGPVRKVVEPGKPKRVIASVAKQSMPSTDAQRPVSELLDTYSNDDAPTPKPESPPLSPAPAPTLSPSPMLKDNRIAYYAEIARKQHEENKRRYNEMLLSLASSSGV